MKQDKKQPEYQVNGPYKAYADRHAAIRASTNKRLILVVIPVFLYMMTRGAVYLLIGAAYLAAVLWTDRRGRARLMGEYTQMERERLAQLESALTALGIPEDRQYTFGYRRTEGDFLPVFLCRCRDTLYLLENVFLKNCVYGVEGQMLYLFDLNREALEKPPEVYEVRGLRWRTSPKNHQDLLRGEGLRLNRFLVIESFIYAAVLAGMRSGKPKEMLHTTYLLTRMRKEKVYEADLPGGAVLVLPQEGEALLSLERDGAEEPPAAEPEKGGAV